MRRIILDGPKNIGQITKTRIDRLALLQLISLHPRDLTVLTARQIYHVQATVYFLAVFVCLEF